MPTRNAGLYAYEGLTGVTGPPVPGAILISVCPFSEESSSAMAPASAASPPNKGRMPNDDESSVVAVLGDTASPPVAATFGTVSTAGSTQPGSPDCAPAAALAATDPQNAWLETGEAVAAKLGQ